ncbi:hypothetical protein BDP27DRAFT_854218 [Rhodocollybia butyracea]|uniref:Alanine dehydrogenase/pyridine nucleotide transhydrogenase N-terminal domain-containing protein n=1 Tax=Rhodocollybia butyracea TaxID=206335 RepID=A0A9P5U6M6_9AGAR|nr:hypothetical protein BDP27DRAFT_854218 [Rhodocollybia butyracea]
MNLLRCNWRSSGIRMYNLGRQRRKEWKRLHTETQRIRSKPLVVGIRREDPSLTWERRVPLTPGDILLISKSFRSQLRNMLTTIHPYQLDEKGELLIPFELEFHVQPCSRRIIPNAQYSAVGAKITEDLSGAHVIIGIKEPRVEEVLVDGLAIPGTKMTGSGYSSIKDKDNCARTYMMFSHTTEGQEYNLPLLDLFLSSGPNSKLHLPTLIDYELLTSESSSKRILTFGFHAGLAGTLLSFHTLGIYQLATLGVASPFLYTPLPQSKRSVDELRAAFHDVGDRIRFEGGTGEGLGPCVVGITGTEDIADGCLSMLSELPIENILVSELEDLVVRRKLRGGDVSLNKVYVVHVKPEDHLVKTLSNSDSSYPVTGSDNPFLKLLSSTTYSRFDYYSHPSTYTSTFATHIAPYLTLLLNGEARVPGFPNLMWRRTLETCVRRVRRWNSSMEEGKEGLALWVI